MTKETDHTEGTVITAIEKMAHAEQKRAYILFLAGPLVGKLHLLEEGVTVIGRSNDITIPINDNRVSRKHVQLTVQGETVTLDDLGSTNGTYVNGQRAAQRVLQDGDKIQISSSTIFKFALQDHTENIFHKELYKMAVMDPVTNIYNKRFLLERLREEFSHARRTQQPLALIMIDIDHFKQINDRYGHLAGDMILQQIAGLLNDTVRQEDILARYGGEEFCVILRGSTEDQAMLLAERMRTIVEATQCVFEKHPIQVTISLGVAALAPDRNYVEPTDLVHAADDCLYRSKQSGRNRTTAVSTKS